MLVATGKGLIMSNAVESLKNKLTDLKVVSSNNDYVAKYLTGRLL
jgi:hydroxymethylpyrimidine pyrophosphatase-like HAD family hydrolase